MHAYVNISENARPLRDSCFSVEEPEEPKSFTVMAHA